MKKPDYTLSLRFWYDYDHDCPRMAVRQLDLDAPNTRKFLDFADLQWVDVAPGEFIPSVTVTMDYAGHVLETLSRMRNPELKTLIKDVVAETIKEVAESA